MKTLKPDARFDLEHRAYFLREWPGTSMFTAAAGDGNVSLVDLKAKAVRLHRPAMKLRAVCPHPTKPIVAWVDGMSGSLVVQSLDGKTVAEVQLPPITAGSSSAAKQGFDDCCFDQGGDVLWLVAPRSGEESELLLVETNGWSVIRKAVVQDEFGESSWSFHRTGRPERVSLWVAAGQDGQQVYWLNRSNDGLTVKRADELTNCIPPVFSTDGSEFLIVTDDNTICRYDFQKMEQLGSPLESGDEDNPFAESLCYLDDRHALASTGEGRVFLINLEQMAVEDEMAIEGHEPRPINVYFPTLASERGLGTDISWFTRLGSTIVFVYRRDRRTDLDGWKDSLLCYSLEK